MRNVDVDLINARRTEREEIVQHGVFIESIEASGKSPEQLKIDAKKVLDIDEDDIIRLEYTNKLAQQNLQTKAFISLANFTAKAESTNILSKEELNTVKDIEAKLAKVVADRYDIDLEELYTEEL